MIRRYCDECGKEMPENEESYGNVLYVAEIPSATTSGKKITLKVQVFFDDHEAVSEGGDLCEACLLKPFTDAAKELPV